MTGVVPASRERRPASRIAVLAAVVPIVGSWWSKSVGVFLPVLISANAKPFAQHESLANAGEEERRRGGEEPTRRENAG